LGADALIRSTGITRFMRNHFLVRHFPTPFPDHPHYLTELCSGKALHSNARYDMMKTRQVDGLRDLDGKG